MKVLTKICERESSFLEKFMKKQDELEEPEFGVLVDE